MERLSRKRSRAPTTKKWKNLPLLVTDWVCRHHSVSLSKIPPPRHISEEVYRDFRRKFDFSASRHSRTRASIEVGHAARVCAIVLPPLKNLVYFDLETQKSADEVGGWNNISAMRMSIGVTFSASARANIKSTAKGTWMTSSPNSSAPTSSSASIRSGSITKCFTATPRWTCASCRRSTCWSNCKTPFPTGFHSIPLPPRLLALSKKPPGAYRQSSGFRRAKCSKSRNIAATMSNSPGWFTNTAWPTSSFTTTTVSARN